MFAHATPKGRTAEAEGPGGFRLFPVMQFKGRAQAILLRDGRGRGGVGGGVAHAPGVEEVAAEGGLAELVGEVFRKDGFHFGDGDSVLHGV